jgi:hypothetical protein
MEGTQSWEDWHPVCVAALRRLEGVFEAYDTLVRASACGGLPLETDADALENLGRTLDEFRRDVQAVRDRLRITAEMEQVEAAVMAGDAAAGVRLAELRQAFEANTPPYIAERLAELRAEHAEAMTALANHAAINVDGLRGSPDEFCAGVASNHDRRRAELVADVERLNQEIAAITGRG